MFKSIIWPILILLTIVLLPRASRADECQATAAKLTAAGEVRLDHVSPSGGTTFFSSPLAQDVLLICDPVHGADLSVHFDTASPSSASFEFVRRLAQIVVPGKARKDVLAALRTCHSRALTDKNELATVVKSGVHVECQAFTRDNGGSSFSISRE